MTGEGGMISMLEKLDFPHDMRQLLAITNSFVGSYQLLPAPAKLPGTLDFLYQADTWPKRAAISQLHLNRAHQFHAGLDTSSTVSATRMIYVAGCQQPTIVGMNIAGRGDFDYKLSHEGDGRVPHALGLLSGVPTFYIEEVHCHRRAGVLRAQRAVLRRFRLAGGREQAGTFATAFYERLFAGEPMCEALQVARQRIFDEALGSTWGACQHYGDPEDVLVRPTAPAAAPRRRAR